jgi:hypothetical protein
MTTPHQLARQVGKAMLMYLGDCEETDTEPTLDGLDGFAGYLVTTFEMGIDLDVELHNELSDLLALIDECADCGHGTHNEDGGCDLCGCHDWNSAIVEFGI